MGRKEMPGASDSCAMGGGDTSVIPMQWPSGGGGDGGYLCSTPPSREGGRAIGRVSLVGSDRAAPQLPTAHGCSDHRALSYTFGYVSSAC